jgi:hypothetical protein
VPSTDDDTRPRKRCRCCCCLFLLARVVQLDVHGEQVAPLRARQVHFATVLCGKVPLELCLFWEDHKLALQAGWVRAGVVLRREVLYKGANK